MGREGFVTEKISSQGAKDRLFEADHWGGKFSPVATPPGGGRVPGGEGGIRPWRLLRMPSLPEGCLSLRRGGGKTQIIFLFQVSFCGGESSSWVGAESLFQGSGSEQEGEDLLPTRKGASSNSRNC